MPEYAQVQMKLVVEDCCGRPLKKREKLSMHLTQQRSCSAGGSEGEQDCGCSVQVWVYAAHGYKGRQAQPQQYRTATIVGHGFWSPAFMSFVTHVVGKQAQSYSGCTVSEFEYIA